MGWEIVFWIATTLLSIALAPKPEEPKAASLADFTVPTADPNRSIPVVFGTVWIEDPNIVWYGDLLANPIEKDGGLFSGDVTVGYQYYVGVHAALCYPVDEILEIRIGDRTAWTGSASGGTIAINKTTLFGGEDREGGVAGTIDVLMGEATQAKNAYLVNKLGSVIPAFRGVLSLVFKQFYWGNSAYIKNPSFKVRRTDIHTDGSPQWYLAKASINGHMNPAHIIRECLTDAEWGMGYPEAIIDDASFTAAADQLYTEGFGLKLRWNRSDSIENFIKQVNDHISAVTDTDPATGLITMRLLRDDYNPADLPLFDESNCTVEDFERRAWGETVNEMTVVYRDLDSNKDTPVTLHDGGNIEIQQNVIPESKHYPGLPTGDLAARVCKRDLRVKASPLAKLTIITDRSAYAMKRSDVFKWSNARRNITEVVFRAVDINRGELTNGKMKITAIEDVFSLDTNTYASPQQSGWTSPNTLPAPALYEQLVEASYWDIQKNMSQADIGQLSADFGFPMTHAVRASGDTLSCQIHSRVGADPYVRTNVGNFCPTAQLSGALTVDGATLTGQVVNISNGLDLDRVEVDRFAYIGEECIAIRAIDTIVGTITIDRGVLDTVPIDHDGTRIWFVEGMQGVDAEERDSGAVVNVKLLPETTLGALDIGSAAALSLTLDHRYQRPYPPGNLQLNASRYPSSTNGDIVITWSHRDRTQQLAALNTQTEGDIGPEVGTTYTIRIIDPAGPTTHHTESGLTGTTWTYTQAARQTDFSGVGPHDVRIEVESVRDGFTSRSYQLVEVTANDV